eukprot:4008069-Amphidinium_carterae.1
MSFMWYEITLAVGVSGLVCKDALFWVHVWSFIRPGRVRFARRCEWKTLLTVLGRQQDRHRQLCC